MLLLGESFMFEINMRLKFSSALLLVFLSVFSYGQTANIVEGCVPLQVNFTAPAGSSNFFWDFQDGATSPLQNPSNTFIDAGVYVVEFSESTTGPVVGTVTITVHEQPVPEITSSSGTVGCVPFAFSVEDNTTLPAGVTGTGFSWSFGDGGSGNGSPTTYTYNSEGVYDVTLQLTTNLASCNATKIFPSYVTCTEPPIASFTTNPSPVISCSPPLNVDFTNNSTSNGSPITYSWDFGNGNTSTDETPTTETYTSSGGFSITMIATDTNGCQNTTSAAVNIGTTTVGFIIPDTVCINTLVSPTNTSSTGSYSWDFGTNATPSTSAATNPAVTFLTEGIHTVSLTNTSGSCSPDSVVQIYVEDPQVTFAAIPTYFCYEPATFNFTGNGPPNVASWDWEFGDDTFGSGQVIDHEYAVPDTSYSEHGENLIATTLTITTTNGCVAEYRELDTIHLPWSRFMPDIAEGCAPLTVTFSDSSRTNMPEEPLTQWEWDYGDGNTDTFANGDPNTYIFTTPGEFDVVLIVTNSAGCTDTSDTIRIEVGDLVALDFSAAPLSICTGEEVDFTNLTAGPVSDLIDAWHYTSDEDRMSHCYQEANPSYIFDNETGFHDVTLTAEYNGCYSSVTKANYIEVKGPIADFTWQKDCDTPMDVLFNDLSSDATSISWDFGDGSPASSLGTVPYAYAATGDYTVILTATNGVSGCPDDKDTVLIHIRTIDAQFTPDEVLCGNQSYTYDASASVDVNEYCNRGYTWFFSEPSMRPITTPLPTEDINLSVTGPQTIGLVVEDINGCVDTLIQDIIVYNGYAAFELSDSTICYPSSVDFTDLSVSDTVITNWDWDFGDGNTSTLTDPTNLFASGPTPTVPVTLTTTDEIGCVETTTFEIDIYEPVSFISTLPNPANVCTNEDVDFFSSDFTSQGSSLSYSWDFGDAGSSADQNPSHSYTNGGNYNVVLTFTEIATGCQGTTNTTVDVQDFPTASFTSDVDGLAALCAPQIVNFTDASTSTSPIVSYAWDFDNGQTSTQNPVSTTFVKGVYDVELTVTTSYNCSNTVTVPYTVIGPEGNFVIDQNNICKGDSIVFTITDTLDVALYSWDFGDGNEAHEVSPTTHVYNFNPPSGQTVAKLTLYGVDSVCPITVSKNIFIHDVVAGFNILDDSICDGDNATLSNTSTPLADILSWTLGDGTTSTSSTTFQHLYATPGSYDVTLSVESSAFGCTDDTTTTIVVHPTPEITAFGDVICPGTLAQIGVENIDPGSFYNWTPATLVFNSTSAITTTTSDTAITYTVTVTDGSTGCTNSDDAVVSVIPEIEDYVFDTIVIIGDSIALPFGLESGLYTYTWTPESGLSCSDCSDPWAGPLLEDIQYTVNIADTLGCDNATYKYFIEVVPETLIELPTTFTPNGDGVNDIIYLGYWGVQVLYEYEIYNRWGELVFHTSDINTGWDGYYNGILQNNDIYVYKVRALTWLNEEIIKEGHIHLMR